MFDKVKGIIEIMKRFHYFKKCHLEDENFISQGLQNLTGQDLHATN